MSLALYWEIRRHGPAQLISDAVTVSMTCLERHLLPAGCRSCPLVLHPWDRQQVLVRFKSTTPWWPGTISQDTEQAGKRVWVLRDICCTYLFDEDDPASNWHDSYPSLRQGGPGPAQPPHPPFSTGHGREGGQQRYDGRAPPTASPHPNSKFWGYMGPGLCLE